MFSEYCNHSLDMPDGGAGGGTPPPLPPPLEPQPIPLNSIPNHPHWPTSILFPLPNATLRNNPAIQP